jgi:uncharacterized protein
MLPLSAHKSGVVLTLRLAPNAADNCIRSVIENSAGDCYLSARVTAVPEKGKANQALIKLLSKALRIPKSDFKIIRGDTDRNKQILISGNTGLLMDHLTSWLNTAQHLDS